MRLIYPMFAMFLLTAVVLARLYLARVRAVREGQIEVAYYRLYQGAAEPPGSAAVARHFENLFEAPVLFYAVCLAGLATHRDSTAMLILAWCYVAARIVHAAVHLTSNRIFWRMRVYMVSWAVLTALWIALVFPRG